MPEPVITRLEQVTPEWLTEVLTRDGALAQGAVAAFDVDTGRGNWSTNASLRVRYVEGAQGARPRRLFLKLVLKNLDKNGPLGCDSERSLERRLMKASAIPSRYRLRVKQRLAIVEYAVTHGIKPASRRFGLERKTVRRWRDCWRARGIAGLVPAYPKERATRLAEDLVQLIHHARKVLQYGAPRTRIWLRRVHKRHVPLATIQRTFQRLGLPRLPRPRKRAPRPRQLKLFEKAEPGASVQVDVKVVKVAGRKVFQYTAIDDCTRYRVLRLYRRQNQWSSLDFFAELRRSFPFRISQLQCDNGSEFPLAFALTVQEAGIRHRYITPRMPEQNGKVERSHRVDSEEFWRRHQFPTFEAATSALHGWERTYNVDRFSMALGGETPAEKLARLLPAFQVA